jgi:hypothetical protein
MTVSEAKSILRFYRPEAPDVQDDAMIEALALARNNPELSAWFEAHCAMEAALRAKFREIVPPAGLKEQIISEHKANRRTVPKASRRTLVATALAIVLVGVLAVFLF